MQFSCGFKAIGTFNRLDSYIGWKKYAWECVREKGIIHKGIVTQSYHPQPL